MNAITRNPKISKPRMSKEYNVSEATVKRTIDALKKRGLAGDAHCVYPFA